MVELTEEFVRAAALAWLTEVTLDGTKPIDRSSLANDFRPGGERFPLVDAGRGIRRPKAWSSALSIMTAAPKRVTARPYDDDEGPDGLHRYKLRRDARGQAENEGLRAAMAQQTPLIWFFGLQPGLFQAIFPVYIIHEEPALDQFVLALTEEQRTVRLGSPMEEAVRRWLLAMTKRRLHQPVFASQVMTAYECGAPSARCTIESCSMPHTSSPTRCLMVRPWCRTGWRFARFTTPHMTGTSLASGLTSLFKSTTGSSTKSTARCCVTACKIIMVGH